jgi:uncharacterized protein YndB with AHSA1/START domain
MPVPRDVVWSTLADGRTYSTWVVGTSSIRDVDRHWPEVGSRLHYRIGRGFLRHDGHTEVRSVDPGRCLELEAHAWPVGTARIQITLHDEGAGTRVEMVEHPARGTAAVLHNPVGDALLRLRNVEALRRLARVVQR